MDPFAVHCFIVSRFTLCELSLVITLPAERIDCVKLLHNRKQNLYVNNIYI